MTTKSDVIETKNGRFWLEDGILRCIVAQGNVQTLEDAQDSMRVFAKLAAGKRRPAVIVISGVKSLSREARTVYSNDEAGKTYSSCAIVVEGSVIARALVNFIVSVSRPPFPTRWFDTVDEALVWVRSLPSPE